MKRMTPSSSVSSVLSVVSELFVETLGFGISRVTTWMNIEEKASCDDRI